MDFSWIRIEAFFIFHESLKENMEKT